MQAEATEQGGDKEWPVHATLAERDRAADRDRQYRGREAERPDDLPHSPCTAGDVSPHLALLPMRSKIRTSGHRRNARRCDEAGAYRRIEHGSVEHGFNLRGFLEDRLEQRDVHPRIVVCAGATGDLWHSAAQDEGIEQLVRDQLAGTVVILGPP